MLYKKQIELFSEEINHNLSHINQINDIECIFLKFKKILKSFNIGNSEELKYIIQKEQIIILTNMLTDILEAIILLLKSKSFLPSDPLSRVALEHSINILYILESQDDRHAKQFIKNYIHGTLEASERWYNYELHQDNKIAMQISKEKIESLKLQKNVYKNLYDENCGNWPKPWKRFQACGHEGAYRTLYSMNSDSIHSFAEDTFNLLAFNSLPKELQEIAKEHFNSVQISMSIYHGIKSLQFYGIVISKVSLKIKSKNDEKSIKKLNKEVEKLIMVHESKFIE
ncbi:hypothetical protein CRU92_05810 [Arcobacter sp. FW59]|nr:hypothetical protein CRU92_05810 [Arcobacter sp. FW59]